MRCSSTFYALFGLAVAITSTFNLLWFAYERRQDRRSFANVACSALGLIGSAARCIFGFIGSHH